ncbi:MAG TPA: hypothetical protein VHM69_03025 [Rubrobacter sp.]|nr:hypothetical protein [Rubrobacter sp.]
MSEDTRRDVARQAANVVGAVFQLGTTAYMGARIQEVVDEGSRSLVEPAAYAFTIWGPIFLLSLAYAVYQALPASRESALFREVGPFTAGSFACTGLWSIFVPARQFALAQVMLLAIFACLAVAFLRLMRSDRGVVGRADRWLVALPLGVFFGWITAANAVSLTSEAVRLGLVEGGATGEVLLGTIMLLLGGILAASVVLASQAGPAHGYLAYGATVLWALAGVVANQYDASLVTTAAAAVAAVLVGRALLVAWRGGRSRREVGRNPRPV